MTMTKDFDKCNFDKGRWHVVSGLCEIDGVTPIQRPIPIAKAIEMGLW